MKTKVATLKTLALLAIASLPLCLAKAAVLDNHVEPLDFLVEVDCDDDPMTPPEDVIQLVGGLHVIVSETTDKKGGVHTTFQYQPVNLSGVGTTSGDTYRGVGLTRGSGTVSGDNESNTFVNNFYIIGQRSGIKYLVRERFHVAVVNGEVIVTIESLEIRCL